MKSVTRDIDPSLAPALLERVPRACLSYAGAHGPRLLPVGVLWQNGRTLVSLPADAGERPEPGQEVVLLVDEGIYYFDLRAIYIRGRAQPAETPAELRSVGAPSKSTWFEVVPAKTVAWDYGSMREVETGDEH